VAGIFGHRPKRQKSTPVILAVNLLPRLGRDAEHAVCMARIKRKSRRLKFCRPALVFYFDTLRGPDSSAGLDAAAGQYWQEA